MYNNEVIIVYPMVTVLVLGEKYNTCLKEIHDLVISLKMFILLSKAELCSNGEHNLMKRSCCAIGISASSHSQDFIRSVLHANPFLQGLAFHHLPYWWPCQWFCLHQNGQGFEAESKPVCELQAVSSWTWKPLSGH